MRGPAGSLSLERDWKKKRSKFFLLPRDLVCFENAALARGRWSRRALGGRGGAGHCGLGRARRGLVVEALKVGEGVAEVLRLLRRHAPRRLRPGGRVEVGRVADRGRESAARGAHRPAQVSAFGRVEESVRESVRGDWSKSVERPSSSEPRTLIRAR